NTFQPAGKRKDLLPAHPRESVQRTNHNVSRYDKNDKRIIKESQANKACENCKRLLRKMKKAFCQ
ncbi:MAG: hypothetical protein IJ649_03755, partial [Oscillospiraceae bacterium]|nr:hypothetical protein [Oscillospiraceae bacterium]